MDWRGFEFNEDNFPLLVNEGHSETIHARLWHLSDYVRQFEAYWDQFEVLPHNLKKAWHAYDMAGASLEQAHSWCGQGNLIATEVMFIRILLAMDFFEEEIGAEEHEQHNNGTEEHEQHNNGPQGIMVANTAPTYSAYPCQRNYKAQPRAQPTPKKPKKLIHRTRFNWHLCQLKNRRKDQRKERTREIWTESKSNSLSKMKMTRKHIRSLGKIPALLLR